MRKLVRTVIINDDEDEDDDEMSIHHRHHHVSRALGMLLVPRGLGGAGSVPVRVGGSSASHRIRHIGAGSGKLLWKQLHERSQQTSGTWRRLLLTKKALKTLLEVVSNPKQP